MTGNQSTELNKKSFDDQFYDDIKPWRDAAEAAGLNMAAFDAGVSSRKAHVDEHVANINYDRAMQDTKE